MTSFIYLASRLCNLFSRSCFGFTYKGFFGRYVFWAKSAISLRVIIPFPKLYHHIHLIKIRFSPQIFISSCLQGGICFLWVLLNSTYCWVWRMLVALFEFVVLRQYWFLHPLPHNHTGSFAPPQWSTLQNSELIWAQFLSTSVKLVVNSDHSHRPLWD